MIRQQINGHKNTTGQTNDKYPLGKVHSPYF